MIEVERKFRASETNSIESRLIEAGYQRREPLHQVDTIYLSESDSFRTFKTGDPVIRIRAVNGLASLTYKRVINPAGDTIEHELSIKPATEAEKLLQELGYKPVGQVDKLRTEYVLDAVTVAVDEVKKLGKFVEVEIVCHPEQEKEAERNIMDAASKLSLNQEDIEPKKYDLLISELKA